MYILLTSVFQHVYSLVQLPPSYICHYLHHYLHRTTPVPYPLFSTPLILTFIPQIQYTYYFYIFISIIYLSVYIIRVYFSQSYILLFVYCCFILYTYNTYSMVRLLHLTPPIPSPPAHTLNYNICFAVLLHYIYIIYMYIPHLLCIYTSSSIYTSYHIYISSHMYTYVSCILYITCISYIHAALKLVHLQRQHWPWYQCCPIFRSPSHIPPIVNNGLRSRYRHYISSIQ